MSIQQINNTLPNVDADGLGGHYQLAEMVGLDGQGNRWQWRAHQDVALFPSEARTATITSGNLTNNNGRGIVVYLDVTAASGTGGLQIGIYGVDPASGSAFFLQGSPLASPFVTTTGAYAAVFYPSAANEGQEQVNFVLPRTFQVSIVHHDSSSYTYSVGACIVL